MCILSYASDNSYTLYSYGITLMVEILVFESLNIARRRILSMFSCMDCKLLTDSDQEKFGF